MRVRHIHRDPEADTGAGQPDGILEVSPIQRATRARDKGVAQEIVRALEDGAFRQGCPWENAPGGIR